MPTNPGETICRLTLLLVKTLPAVLAPAAYAAVIDLSRGSDFAVYGFDEGDGMGSSVLICDLDGDSVGDVIVGAPDADGASDFERDFNCGEVYVIFGGEEVFSTPPGSITQKADIQIVGSERGANLGSALAAADVTGDGIDDLIVGACGATAPRGERAGFEDAGAIYVIVGRSREEFPERMATPGACRAALYGSDAGDRLGCSIDSGDFDGDGRVDLATVAFYGSGPANDRSHAGEAYLILGTSWPSLDGSVDIRGAADLTVYGRDPDDTMRAVHLGDLDGDGKDDLVLGVYYGDGANNEIQNAGEVYVCFGRTAQELPDAIDLAGTSPDIAVYGDQKLGVMGRSVCSGDVDGDGLEDLFMGAYLAAGGPPGGGRLSGEAYGLFGRPRDEFPSELGVSDCDFRVWGSDEWDWLGRPVLASDVDGDALADFFVSAAYADGPGNERNRCGEVFVFLGAPRREFISKSGAPEAANVVIVGPVGKGDTASAIAVGDIDGDGLADLLLGSRSAGAPGDGPARAGRVDIVTGRSLQGPGTGF